MNTQRLTFALILIASGCDDGNDRDNADSESSSGATDPTSESSSDGGSDESSSSDDEGTSSTGEAELYVYANGHYACGPNDTGQFRLLVQGGSDVVSPYCSSYTEVEGDLRFRQDGPPGTWALRLEHFGGTSTFEDRECPIDVTEEMLIEHAEIWC